MKATTIVKSLVCAGMLLAGSMASAALIITTSPSNTGTDNVLSNTCTGNVIGPALTVQGCLNTNSNLFVNFTGTENLTYTGGQAVLTADANGFNSLIISLSKVGATFKKIVLNIDALADGFVTFTGQPSGASSSSFALGANGSNFFTITSDNASDFTSLAFTTSVAISDVSQIRLGGVVDEVGNPVAVPEPGVLMLMGIGLVGLGMGRKFKAKKA